MRLDQILNYLGIWSLTGIILFNLIVVYMFRSGRVFQSRSKEGHLKKMTLKSMLPILLFLGIVIAFILAGNYISLVRSGVEISFWRVFALNMALITILVIYDSLVIDWWVIGFWRPAILQLPDEMDKEQMWIHIKRTFVVAPAISVVIALLSAAFSVLIW